MGMVAEDHNDPEESSNGSDKIVGGSLTGMGTFHAHLNAIQRVAREKIASALILEETVDWDVNLKMQLKGFASGVKLMQGSNATVESPYGDRWDLLWLGHCGMKCATDSTILLTPHDITAVPSRYLDFYQREPPAGVKNQMRLACQVEEVVGSLAYAITFEGAQKLHAALSVVIAKEENLDVVVSRLCRAGTLKCFSSYPSLLGGRNPGHKLAQNNPKDADFNEECSPGGIMFSTLTNLDRPSNDTVTVRAAYHDVVVQEIDPDQFEIPHAMLKWRDGQGEHELAL
ncbi:uncharacterized protein BO97DRAFT_409488 [Aspergillus homomorphus CBS 101889]|uniref:Uncharacterized protein n=1 Tax=Aspergillus homomorphus (strain CBS 101889) TaxID=1450537 RepID=A0A395HFR1_ASPHC|nr:hypothetical protein BO97DRAFT_409488 [Aspergillus homomorphus CBS 101889]RAL06697.1 hypothetical protein BO97DRAFT_409488 [Aspergillus homomorphus CBS 101889]